MIDMTPQRDRNDELRRKGDFGPGTDNPLYMTPGVQALGEAAIAALYVDIMTYDNFTSDTDFAGLHDLGVLSFDGTEVWFKIDIQPDQTRVFTLLLPEEF